MSKYEIILNRFDSGVGMNNIIQGGIYHFDNKPFIMKAWSLEMEFTREELHTVPIWIKSPGLDFKYWSPKGLRRIGNLFCKPLMVDQNIERKVGLNFARLLVDRNEKGILVEQRVVYDLKPTICTYCKKYRHSEEDFRKKKIPKTQMKASNKLVDQKAKNIPQHPQRENGDKIQQVTLPGIELVTKSHPGK